MDHIYLHNFYWTHAYYKNKAFFDFIALQKCKGKPSVFYLLAVPIIPRHSVTRSHDLTIVGSWDDQHTTNLLLRWSKLWCSFDFANIFLCGLNAQFCNLNLAEWMIAFFAFYSTQKAPCTWIGDGNLNIDVDAIQCKNYY